MTNQATVSVINADLSARALLSGLLERAGYGVELLVSAEDYLRQPHCSSSNCLVLDIELPGHSGLDLQTQLAQLNWPIPLVFVTSIRDIPSSVRAMKAGAVDYLTRPFRSEELLAAVQQAVALDRVRCAEHRAMLELRKRFMSLSRREQETMALITAGSGVKRIAARLGICAHTARVHSSRVMTKMSARSVPDLARMADKLECTSFPNDDNPFAKLMAPVN